MKGGDLMNKEIYLAAERKMEKEVDEIVSKDHLSVDDLELLYKLLDNLKDISIICAMKEETEGGYSERRYTYDDESYARGRGRGARRDSMGRYASEGSYERGSYESYGRDSYGRDSYERGYSSDEQLDKMMQNAKTERERELIRQLKEVQK